MASQSVPTQPTSNPIPNSHPNLSTQNTSTRKRVLDHAQSSPYFKMRAVLKDLRPLFLEVLRDPDFQGTEAARGIQEKTKLMLDLCKQMTMEAPPIMKCNNGSGNQGFASKKQDGHGEKPAEPQQDGKTVEQPDSDREFLKPGEEKDSAAGTYVVGGSAFGWNFVTFTSSKPVYYGRSKESFRAANPKSEIGEALSM